MTTKKIVKANEKDDKITGLLYDAAQDLKVGDLIATTIDGADRYMLEVEAITGNKVIVQDKNDGCRWGFELSGPQSVCRVVRLLSVSSLKRSARYRARRDAGVAFLDEIDRSGRFPPVNGEWESIQIRIDALMWELGYTENQAVRFLSVVYCSGIFNKWRARQAGAVA